MKRDHISNLIFLVPPTKNEVVIANEMGDTKALASFSNDQIQDVVLIPSQKYGLYFMIYSLSLVVESRN